ncbi:MAG: NADH-quinone oxidoreductase subunit N [Saprospiraceae bacterium]|nr:NADH-quinone oxidoreductase subunit N [Saprospiraceae bacterium]
MASLLLLFLTAVVALFAGLFKKRDWLQPITLLGVALAMGLALADTFVERPLNSQYASMLHFDAFALVFSAISLLATLLVLGLSRWGFRELSDTLGDNYGLFLFSLCGALCMFSFSNMVMLFLGIEILSIPLYVLAGSRRDDLKSNEAALKYFLMGAFATGILLFGIALVYGATASFDLRQIQAVIAANGHSPQMLSVGILLILIGLSFKVSAAPFHFWAPDVYTGSPTLITAFMATVVKTAGFAAFFRLFSTAFVGAGEFWSTAVAMVAGLTMTLANTTAIFQTNFKRMMAYSSISHAGYLMLAVLAPGHPGAAGALIFYTLTYSVATVCAFGCFLLVSEQNQDETFAAFNGLSKKQPLIAAAMALSMLTLAGIPPTAGFFGKYFLFSVAFERYPWLVVLAVLNSAVSVYYYFKVLIAMYFSPEENAYQVKIPRSVRWTLAAGLVLIALLTLFPATVTNLI